MAVAVVELNVAITQFHNVDLFEKGHYQVKCFLDPIRDVTLSQVNLQLPKNSHNAYHEHASPLGPGTLLQSVEAGFQTVPALVKYSDDQFDIRTGMQVCLEILIPSTQVDFTQKLESIYADLHLELWFHSKDINALKRVARKHLRLHHVAWPGIRYGSNHVFDFFHTCSVDLTISSVLLGFDIGQKKPSKKNSLALVVNPKPPPRNGESRKRTASGSSVRARNARSASNDVRGWSMINKTSAGRYEVEDQEDIDLDTSIGSVDITDIATTATSMQENCNTEPLKIMHKRFSVLGNLVSTSLSDLKDSLTALLLDSAANEVGQSHGVVHSSMNSALERIGQSEEEEVVVSEFWKFLNSTRRLCFETWSAVRESYMYDLNTFQLLDKDSRLHQLSQLEQGYYVLEHPASGLLQAACSRGPKLTAMATSLRTSKFFHILKSSWVEDLTNPIAPKLGPIIAEYRTFADTFATPESPLLKLQKQKCHAPPKSEEFEEAHASFRQQLGNYAKFIFEAGLPHVEALDDGTTGKGHLIVCVHGLSGNQYDLRALKLHLLKSLPDLDFMMSSCNTENTHASFDAMTTGFQEELFDALNKYKPTRVSFIGHSLGNIIIRSALSKYEVQAKFQLPFDCDPKRRDVPTSNPKLNSSMRMESPRNSSALKNAKPVLHTFVSLAGPHLGAVYLNGMISTGMWILSKWKRSSSLNVLSLSDTTDPRNSFLYRLSKTNSMKLFQNIILLASPQDRYVTLSSALVHPSLQSSADGRLGPVYNEMAHNLIDPLVNSKRINIVRTYIMLAPGPRTVASIIGRAAHIACLDDDHVAQKVAVGIVRYLVC